jgi:hypothetical protein
MAKSSYRGYARVSGSLDNLNVPDPSQKILQRNQAYLEDLRETKKFERIQEANAFQQYQKNQQATQDSIQTSLAAEIKGNEITERYKKENVRKKQEAMNLAFTSQRNAGGKDIMSIANALVDFSKTAANVVGDFKKASAEAKVEKQGDDAHQVKIDNLSSWLDKPSQPVRVTSASQIGFEAAKDSAGIISANQSASAAVLNVSGNPIDSLNMGNNAAQSRKPVTNPVRQKLSIDRELNLKLATMNPTININGQEVQMQNMTAAQKLENADLLVGIGLSELGIDVTTMSKEAGKSIYDYATEKSGAFFTDVSKKGIDAYQQNEISDAAMVFQQDPTPMNASGMYMSFFNSKGGDDRAARAAFFEEVESNNYSDEAVATLLDTKVPGRNGSWKAEFPGDAEELLRKRSSNDVQVAQALDDARVVADLERSEAITQGAIKDLEDGVYNGAGPEEIAKQIAKYTATGDTETVKALEALIPMTASAQMDTAIDKSFTELLVNGVQGDLTPKMILESRLSPKKKTAWLAKVKEFNATAPGTGAVREAKQYITDTLKGRAKYNPLTSESDPSLNRAINSGVKQYQMDYKQAMLNPGTTPSQAAEYALGRFQEQFGNKPYEGRYRVGDPRSGQPAEGATSFVDPSFAVEPTADIYEFNSAKINQTLTNDPSAIDKPNLINKKLLEQVSVQSLQKKGMPAQIQYIAARSNKPAFEILNRQLKANGLTEIPQAVYTAANEAQYSIDGTLQHLLNQYPTPTRTDIAMIGSGQEPIYAQSTPLGERVKEIVGSRESPANGYDAVNRGTGGDTPGGIKSITGKSFNQMTVGEVKRLGKIPLSEGGIGAAGFYQFMPKTLIEAAAEAGVTDDMMFNEAVQDRIFFVHLKNRGIHQPWEKWWIQQGGSDLKLTPFENATIEAFLQQYDPTKPWSHPQNINPAVVRSVTAQQVIREYRSKEEGPGAGDWKWDEQRQQFVKVNAN